MIFPPDITLKRLRHWFPPGLRLELIEMVNDPLPIAPGTSGTVIGVGCDGSIEMAWDDGRRLSLLPDAGDRFKVV
jgi:hypothetical protein